MIIYSLLIIISVLYFWAVVCRHASNLVHSCHIGHCFETYQPWTEESKDTSGCWVFFGVDHGAGTQSTLVPIFVSILCDIHCVLNWSPSKKVLC